MSGRWGRVVLGLSGREDSSRRIRISADMSRSDHVQAVIDDALTRLPTGFFDSR